MDDTTPTAPASHVEIDEVRFAEVSRIMREWHPVKVSGFRPYGLKLIVVILAMNWCVDDAYHYDIAEQTGWTPATTEKYLRELVRQGAAEPDGNGYRLSNRMLVRVA